MGRLSLAFSEAVDLYGERCADKRCDMILAMSTEHVGLVGQDADGLPTLQIWHFDCAPTELQDAQRELRRGRVR
jgi:hypothetical protein